MSEGKPAPAVRIVFLNRTTHFFSFTLFQPYFGQQAHVKEVCLSPYSTSFTYLDQRKQLRTPEQGQLHTYAQSCQHTAYRSTPKMNNSGYNDPAKLADALALARSFKSGGSDSYSKKGGSKGKKAAATFQCRLTTYLAPFVG